MEAITSVQNEKIKQANKLKKKKERDKTGRVLIEGIHLIEEAVQSDIQIEQLFCLDVSRVDEQVLAAAKETYEITFKVAEALSGTVTPQGVFAIIQKPVYDVKNGQRILLVDRIQDPGNLGTLIRTADAAGFDLILLEKGTTDAYQDKVLRASQGSVFHIAVQSGNLAEFIASFEGPVYGTALEDAVDYKTITSPASFALLLGNEGEGVAPELLSSTTQNLTIPIYGQAESLNVAIAGSILMYHLRG